MINADQVIHARWVIPVSPDNLVLEHHSVVIADHRILAVMPTAECRASVRSISSIERPTHALIPGLINTHTHAAMTLFRGLADDLPLKIWLEQHIWPAEARFGDREFVRDGTRLAAAEMLRGGTTCFQDMYFFPDETAAAAIDAGLRAVVGMIVIGFPTAWASNTQEYLSNGQRIHDRYRDHPLIRVAFAPHAPYTVDDATLTRVGTLAEELDVPIHMHVQETTHEVEESIRLHHSRPLARLESLGLLSSRLIAVHMTGLDTHDIERVAKFGVTVAHCPESNMKLASGICPVAPLLAAGVNVTLGTDGAASNNDLDMLAEMRTAALLAKLAANDPCAAPAHTILRMATLNAAKALGLEQEIGSITVGKQADLVAIDFNDPRAQPVYHPISQIVYATHRDQVSDVWVAGRQVVDAHTLLTLDEPELMRSAQRWREKIAP